MSLTPPPPSDPPPHAGQPPGEAEPSDPDARIDAAVIAAREAAIRAFTEKLDRPTGDTIPEVRLMITATRGNPSTEHSHSEVRFAAPDGVATSHHDKVAMALASMKAVSPDIYATMMAGINRGRRMTFGGLRACLRAAAR